MALAEGPVSASQARAQKHVPGPDVNGPKVMPELFHIRLGLAAVGALGPNTCLAYPVPPGYSLMVIPAIVISC